MTNTKANEARTAHELLALVNVALGYGAAASCTAGDVDHDGRLTIDEIQTAVSNALDIRVPGFVRLVVQRRRC